MVLGNLSKLLKCLLHFLDSILTTCITAIEGEIGSRLRYYYYRLRIKKAGGYFISYAGFRMIGTKLVSIGKNCSFNRGVFIGASEEIVIGDNVMIGPYTVLRDANHKYDNLQIPIALQGNTTGKIIIGNDVWIGANCVILKDVKIGDHSIVAAHSLVNKDIGEYEIWGGVPARLIKSRK